MVVDDNTPLPVGAIRALPVRAQNILNAMDFPKTYGGIKSITEEMLLARRNSGALTVRQIMQFKAACENGVIQPERPVVIPRIADELPPLTIKNLSVRARNVLERERVELTPCGICALDNDAVRAFNGAGKKVVEELMALKARCLSGDVWDDEVKEVVEEEIRPKDFTSLSEYVMAVAARTCRLGEHSEKVIAGRFGLLNVETVKSLDILGREFGGVSRQRVDQIATKLERELFSAEGKAMFAEFVHSSEAVFSRNRGVLKAGDLVLGLTEFYPNWEGTTEFSALRLLKYCGVAVEKNDSGYMAWMTGGDIEDRYETYLGLLEDKDEPLENLTQEAVLRDADLLGLDEISEAEYRFIVQRIFDNNRRSKGAGKARWSLFLRLRCGLHASAAERRRYVVSRALRAAGMHGLTQLELVDACRAIDPDVDIGTERNQESDASPSLKYDMDGTGARLMIYDFGDRAHDKRFSLDVFFNDSDLVRVVKEAGVRLRKHMEKNCLGAANITRLCNEIKADLPEKYSDGLPSACLYALMREQEAGGLKYYDHPNVAHPGILDESGTPPRQAISWLIYEYFLMAGHETATWSQLLDFCELMLGMDGAIAAATVMPPIKGEKVVVDGEERYVLKAPDENIDPPNVLIDGGEIDSGLSFSKPRGPQGMNFGSDGKARDINTYVRSFLYDLVKSGYAFSEGEKTELADPGWCEAHLGVNKAAFIPYGIGSQRPNTNYWRVTYRIGDADYWVSSYWVEKYKFRFDVWAQSLAERAGFTFTPYEIPLEG